MAAPAQSMRVNRHALKRAEQKKIHTDATTAKLATPCLPDEGRNATTRPEKGMCSVRLRIAAWASAGVLFASGWPVYFRLANEDLPIEPIVHTCSVNLPGRVCGFALPDEPRFPSWGKCRHVRSRPPSGGNRAAAFTPLKIIQMPR